MGRDFYVYKNKHGTYIAEFLNPETGARICKRNTGARNRDEALLTAGRWSREGIPERKRGRAPVYKKPAVQLPQSLIGLKAILEVIEKTRDLDEAEALRIAEALRDRGLLNMPCVMAGKGNKDFISFLEEFWDYDKSQYVKELKAAGQSIHKRHCHEMLLRLRSFYAGYFKGRKLNSITRQDFKKFSLHLAEPRKKQKNYKGPFAEILSASSRNKILTVSKTALRWAFHEGLIPADPTAGLKKITGEVKKRGILTQAEAGELFKSVTWNDKRAYAASLLAATTGLRSGEVLALRADDIQEKYLHIKHSWSSIDGLKKTKTNEDRKVNLYNEVKKTLIELLDENPHKEENPFIFHSLYPGQPADRKVILKGLQDAMEKTGIEYKGRNISFHSWRHYWAAYMAPQLQKEKLMLSTGHKTKEIFDVYAGHEIAENLEEVGRVGAEVFSNILQFKKTG